MVKWFDYINQKVHGFAINYCSPIETPEEKAERLRAEWCSKVMDFTPASDTSVFLITAQENQTKRIYDALLSGDLPVPVKGE